MTNAESKYLLNDGDSKGAAAVGDTRGKHTIAFPDEYHTMQSVLEGDAIYADVNSGEEENGKDESHAERKDIPFYYPALQRQRWGETQVLPHVNWGDLFFDLFYVGAAFNLGTVLKHSEPAVTWRDLAYFAGMFGPLITMWINKMQYDSRFTIVDDAHRYIEVFRVCFLAMAVMHIREVSVMADVFADPTTFIFATGLFLESVMEIVINLDLFFFGKGDRPAIKNQSKQVTLVALFPSCLLYLAATVSSALFYFQVSNKSESLSSTDSFEGENGWSKRDFPIMLCLLSYVWYFGSWIILVAQRRRSNDSTTTMVPMNIEFSIHRYGEWIMLMLGESVLSLLIVEPKQTIRYYAVVLFGVLTIVLLHALNFRIQPSHADEHALRRNMIGGLGFIFSTNTYSMALVALGASYKRMLLYGIHDNPGEDAANVEESFSESNDVDQGTATLFGISLLFCLLTLEITTLCHNGMDDTLTRFSKANSGGGIFIGAGTLFYFSKFVTLLITLSLPFWLFRAEMLAAAGMLIVWFQVYASKRGLALGLVGDPHHHGHH